MVDSGTVVARKRQHMHLLNDNVPPTELEWERLIPADPHYSDTPVPPPNVDHQTGDSRVPSEITALAQEDAFAAFESRPMQVDKQVSEGVSEPLVLRVHRSQVNLWRARQYSVNRSVATTNLVNDPSPKPTDIGEPDEDSNVTS